MTDQELRDLVAENSRAIRAQREESERQREESERRREEWQESRQESKRRWEESDRRWEESQRQWQKSDRRWEESREEILASRRETDRLITSLERRLGEIGNALGLYTESAKTASTRSSSICDGFRAPSPSTEARSSSVSWPPSRSPRTGASRP